MDSPAVRLVATFIAIFVSFQLSAQPTEENFKQVFVNQLQKLKPDGFTKRTVLFHQVIKGKPNGGVFPFKVVAFVHDYAPGYPANSYYGQTCLGKMDGWIFNMLKNDFGEWIVQGRFTITGNASECKDNPSEGVEAFPLANVPAVAYKPGKVSTVKEEPAGATSKLFIGEYACYGTGGRLMAGMGFTLFSGGKYVDLDNSRGGTFSYNSQLATITFKGGFLDGQVGKNVGASGFKLSSTVNCEPWR